jgi:hypothetical protein
VARTKTASIMAEFLFLSELKAFGADIRPAQLDHAPDGGGVACYGKIRLTMPRMLQSLRHAVRVWCLYDPFAAGSSGWRHGVWLAQAVVVGWFSSHCNIRFI